MDTEGASNAKNQNSTSGGGGVEESSCPICLAPFLQESFLDTCFHKFCYDCILQWTKVVAAKHSRRPSSVKCPLCKTDNFSIIYGYDGSSYQQHYFNQNVQDSFILSKAHKYRLQCYYTQPGLLYGVVDVSHYWKSCKYLQPNRWLQSWLRREIQALTQKEDVDIIVHHILGVVESFLRRNDEGRYAKKPELQQEEFKALIADAARTFLGARTDRFSDELELFLASGFNIEAYDEMYVRRLGWSTPGITTNDETEGKFSLHTVPYLYIFDDDSDETDDSCIFE